MTGRRYLTQKQKAELFLKQDGKCAGCGNKLITGLFQHDHIRDLQFDGGNELDNWQILCTAGNRCHQKKTRLASKQSAHIDRIRFGKTRKGPPVPGSRNTPFKKPFYGPAIRRP